MVDRRYKFWQNVAKWNRTQVLSEPVSGAVTQIAAVARKLDESPLPPMWFSVMPTILQETSCRRHAD
jgi:hypothetical protein